MRTILALLLASTLLGTAAGAQQPSFDSASVKQNFEAGKPGTVGTTMSVTPTGITFSEVSLMNCITEAYGVTSYQVEGPRWIRTEWFDIAARSAAPATRDEQMVMLQRLLAERFKLTLRVEKRAMKVLALAAEKNGPRGLKPSANGNLTMTMDPDGLSFRHQTMAGLARYLSRQGPIGAPVVDRTGIQGAFDFAFPFLKKVDASAAGGNVKKALIDGGPTAYRDAAADLGLTLRDEMLPMDVLIVVSAERVPVAN